MISFLGRSALVTALVSSFLPSSGAQYLPPPKYERVLRSPLDPSVTVAYKSPDPGTCTTAFSTQKQYTGYIGLPPFTLAPIQQNYSINTFFWFVEARQTPETAPLTIWLNGGPGSSSMIGFFNEIGPCKVVQLNDGSYGTQNTMWGWDRSSNVLFIDQPNQVGFSYDTATNSSYNFFTNQALEPPVTSIPGLPSFMYQKGTFGTSNGPGRSPSATTANTTAIAAQATWHFLQTWLAAFPQYNPATRPNVTTPNSMAFQGPVGINLFTESYGGKYGPVFATYFAEQNQKRDSGLIPSNSTLEIQIEVLGIVNGLIDDAIQDQFYPSFAYNNTFGIRAITQTAELNLIQSYNEEYGCLSQIIQCRAAMSATDPDGHGDVNATNTLCESAQRGCSLISAPYLFAGYDAYDIRQKVPSPDPPSAYQEYLNNASVLQSIGAKVNFTVSNVDVQAAFISTGDTIRAGQVDDLASLLEMGIRVALIYGDADYICNWFGGEAISLAVADLVTGPSTYATSFPAAGYAEIVTNASYVGGAVRQYGNLSFSRVYDAGHFVPYFQPETAFTIFTRIIQGTDVATGDIPDLSNYSSQGPMNATHVNANPIDANNPTASASAATPSATCWIRDWNSTCTHEDTRAMLAGVGVVQNGVYYQNAALASSAQQLLTSASVTAGFPGRPIAMSSPPSVALAMSAGSSSSSSGSGQSSAASSVLTGVYTATSTPTPSGAASRLTPVRFSTGFSLDSFLSASLSGILPVVAIGLGLGWAWL